MINEAIWTGQEVILSGKIEVSAKVRNVTKIEWQQLNIWRHILQVPETAAIQTVIFDADGKHDRSLAELLHRVRASLCDEAPAILYLHRGHQLDTRSPVLQSLLNLLEIERNVFSLRVEDAAALHDALTLASGLLHRHERVLVLHDEIERVSMRGHLRNSLSVSYSLLARESIDRFDQSVVAQTVGLAQLPGSALTEACP
jgi:hypothetical protein